MFLQQKQIALNKPIFILRKYHRRPLKEDLPQYNLFYVGFKLRVTHRQTETRRNFLQGALRDALRRGVKRMHFSLGAFKRTRSILRRFNKLKKEKIYYGTTLYKYRPKVRYKLKGLSRRYKKRDFFSFRNPKEGVIISIIRDKKNRHLLSRKDTRKLKATNRALGNKPHLYYYKVGTNKTFFSTFLSGILQPLKTQAEIRLEEALKGPQKKPHKKLKRVIKKIEEKEREFRERFNKTRDKIFRKFVKIHNNLINRRLEIGEFAKKNSRLYLGHLRAWNTARDRFKELIEKVIPILEKKAKMSIVYKTKRLTRDKLKFLGKRFPKTYSTDKISTIFDILEMQDFLLGVPEQQQMQEPQGKTILKDVRTYVIERRKKYKARLRKYAKAFKSLSRKQQRANRIKDLLRKRSWKRKLRYHSILIKATDVNWQKKHGLYERCADHPEEYNKFVLYVAKCIDRLRDIHKMKKGWKVKLSNVHFPIYTKEIFQMFLQQKRPRNRPRPPRTPKQPPRSKKFVLKKYLEMRTAKGSIFKNSFRKSKRLFKWIKTKTFKLEEPRLLRSLRRMAPSDVFFNARSLRARYLLPGHQLRIRKRKLKNKKLQLAPRKAKRNTEKALGKAKRKAKKQRKSKLRRTSLKRRVRLNESVRLYRLLARRTAKRVKLIAKKKVIFKKRLRKRAIAKRKLFKYPQTRLLDNTPATSLELSQRFIFTKFLRKFWI